MCLPYCLCLSSEGDALFILVNCVLVDVLSLFHTHTHTHTHRLLADKTVMHWVHLRLLSYCMHVWIVLSRVFLLKADQAITSPVFTLFTSPPLLGLSIISIASKK